jgi:NifU-like protein involved in Fe-S cluster formation
MDDLQALFEGIRKSIVAEAEQKFADETFQHLRYLRYSGRMRNPDAMASITRSGGDSMEMYLKFYNGQVCRASYLTDGDGLTCLCGSSGAELAIGKTARELMELKATDVVKRIGRSGEGIEQRAMLAVEALHKAAENFLLTRTENYSPRKKSLKPRFIAAGRNGTNTQYCH